MIRHNTFNIGKDLVLDLVSYPNIKGYEIVCWDNKKGTTSRAGFYMKLKDARTEFNRYKRNKKAIEKKRRLQE